MATLTLNDEHSPTSFYSTWGQFHQPYGTEHKCDGSHSSAPVSAIQLHQQNYAELHLYDQLENTLNFYAVRPALYANKFGVNLLAQKPPLEN